MAKNRGEVFEEYFRASIPPEVEARKLSTPGPRAQSLGQIGDMLKRFAKKADEEVPGWAMGLLNAATHTPKQPYDLLLLAPAASTEDRFATWWKAYRDRVGSPIWTGSNLSRAELLRSQLVGDQLYITPEEFVGEHDAAWAAVCAVFEAFGGCGRDHTGAPMWIPARPMLAFALELKSAGASKSLPFDRLKDHQEAGLAKAAFKGAVAGVVVEFPDVSADGEVWFIPIGTWKAHRRECGRQSLSADAARACGQLIAIDPNRGRVHRYFKVAEFLRHYGADVPPTF